MGAKLLLAAGGTLYSGALQLGDDGANAVGYQVSNFGDLSPTTYVDRGGNTRTIVAITHDSGTGNIVLVMSGSVANDNATFAALVLPGGVLLRSAASYASPSNSSWTWSSASLFGASPPSTVPMVLA